MSKQLTFKIDGMSCQHCVQTVTDTLSALPGIDHVNVNLKKGQASMQTTAQLDPGQIAAAVQELGFSAQPIETPQKSGLLGLFGKGKKD